MAVETGERGKSTRAGGLHPGLGRARGWGGEEEGGTARPLGGRGSGWAERPPGKPSPLFSSFSFSNLFPKELLSINK